MTIFFGFIETSNVVAIIGAIGSFLSIVIAAIGGLYLARHKANQNNHSERIESLEQSREIDSATIEKLKKRELELEQQIRQIKEDYKGEIEEMRETHKAQLTRRDEELNRKEKALQELKAEIKELTEKVNQIK